MPDGEPGAEAAAGHERRRRPPGPDGPGRDLGAGDRRSSGTATGTRSGWSTARSAHRRTVTVGTQGEDAVAVTAGLRVGERVVVRGVDQVREGQELS